MNAHSPILPIWPIVLHLLWYGEGRQAGCAEPLLFPGLMSPAEQRAQPAEMGQGETRGQDQAPNHWVTGATLKQLMHVKCLTVPGIWTHLSKRWLLLLMLQPFVHNRRRSHPVFKKLRGNGI